MIQLRIILVLIFLLGGFLRAQETRDQDIIQLKEQLAGNPSDERVLVQLARIYHDLGAAGEGEAVDTAFDYVERALSVNPSGALALAYRGSLWTLRGRDAFWPMTKLNHVKKGTEEMDEAVRRAPEDVMVRLVRGINSVNLPEFFDRLPVAWKDFNYLLRRPDFSRFTAKLQSAIYCWSGITFRKYDEEAKAKELFEKAIALASDPFTDRLAREQLKELQ